MSGADDVPVVWVEKAAPHEEDAARALGEWGRARGLRVVAPSEVGGSTPVRVELALAEAVERELDRAREAVAALDADAADRALARADAVLREHPELPQAAWLRAEVHRGWAARWTRIEPRDDLRAQLAWQDAEALDGGRAAGVGEVVFPPRPTASATLAVQGGGLRNVVVRLDGVELAARRSAEGTLTYALEAPPAEHQVVVTVDGDAVFASWVSIASPAAGAPRPLIAIPIGDEGACSASSLASVVREGETVRAAGVSCESWVAAAPAERRGTVLVARCQRSTCGPFLEWRSESSFGSSPDQPASPHGAKWPAWATWTALGVGGVAAATLTIVATGVFASRPTEPRFVAGGVRTE